MAEILRVFSSPFSPKAARFGEEKDFIIDVEGRGIDDDSNAAPAPPSAKPQSYVPLKMVKSRIAELRGELAQTKERHADVISDMARAYETMTHDNRSRCQAILDQVQQRASHALQTHKDIICKLASEKKRLSDRAEALEAKGAVVVPIPAGGGAAASSAELVQLRASRDLLTAQLERVKQEDVELREQLAAKNTQLTAAVAMAAGNADELTKQHLQTLQDEVAVLQGKNDELRGAVTKAETDALAAQALAATAATTAVAAAAVSAAELDDQSDGADELPARLMELLRLFGFEKERALAFTKTEYEELEELCGVVEKLPLLKSGHEGAKVRRQTLQSKLKEIIKETAECKELTADLKGLKQEINSIATEHKEIRSRRKELQEKYDLSSRLLDTEEQREELKELVALLQAQANVAPKPKKAKAPVPAPVSAQGSAQAAQALAQAQAQHASQIKAVQARLDEGVASLAETAARLAKRDEELRVTQEKIAELTKNLALSEAKVTTLTTDLDVARTDLQALQAADSENAKIKVWQDKATSLELRLAELSEQVQNSAAIQAEMGAVISGHEQKVQSLTEAKEATEKALEASKQSLVAAQAAAASAQAAAASAAAAAGSAGNAAAPAASPLPVTTAVAGVAAGGGASSAEVSQLQATVLALTAQKETLDKELEEAKKENAALSVKASANGKDLQKKLKAEYQGKIDTLQAEHDALTADVATRVAEVEGLNAKLAAEVAAKEGVQKEFADLKEEQAKLQADSASALGQVTELRTTISTHEATIETNETAIKELKEESKELSAFVEKGEDMLREETVRRKEFQFKYEEAKGKVRVYARVRPMSKMELKKEEEKAIRQGPNAWTIELDEKQSDVMGVVKEKWRSFQFDAIFLAGTNGRQDQVFNECETFGEMAMQGVNACIFAYGQSGTGKTFTMAGKHTPELKGLKPRFIDFVYGLANANKKRVDYKISCYMVEIYLNKLEDLFFKNNMNNKHKKKANWDETPELKIRVDRKKKVTIENVVTKSFDTAEEMHAFTDQAETMRRTRSTGLNEESSRSHLIFALCIEARDKKTGKKTLGKLSLCDLAGSERADKTNVEGLSDKARQEMLEEGKAINESLRMLKNVFLVLGQESTQSDKKRKTLVQYRGNMLTELMQDSLGGNARTLMFVNVGPAASNVPESIDSLQYGDYVKNITNEATGEDADHLEQIRFLTLEIAKYKAKFGDI